MDRILKVLISTNCELLVAPRNDIYDPSFVYLEFVVSDYNDTYSSACISEFSDVYKFRLKEDGLYMYYRLKIPTKTSLASTDLTDRLYFDDTVGIVMLGDKEVTCSEQLHEIIDSDFPESKYGFAEFIEYPVFSICRISACLENMQRKFIFTWNSNNESTMCKRNSDDNKAERDFLFSTIFVLKTLIKHRKYEEALRILNTVNSCNSICKNTYTSKNSCGCK